MMKPTIIKPKSAFSNVEGPELLNQKTNIKRSVADVNSRCSATSGRGCDGLRLDKDDEHESSPGEAERYVGFMLLFQAIKREKRPQLAAEPAPFGWVFHVAHKG